jgi:myo-inositol-1(or 4)-monophosphatase
MIDKIQVPGLGKQILKESGLVSTLRKLNAQTNRSARKALKANKKDISIAADKELNRKLIKFLSSKSSYPILSEESDEQFDFAKAKGRIWIIDPLDGSMNFFRGIPMNCVSIALWENGKPLFGMIYDFNRDELFESNARRSYLNGKSIEASRISKTSNGVLTTGFPSWRSYESKSLTRFLSQVQNWKKIRMIGSAALSLAWIACGRMEAYIEEDVRIWDVAAGLAIVKGAGGKIVCRPRNRANFVTAIATNSSLMTNFRNLR